MEDSTRPCRVCGAAPTPVPWNLERARFAESLDDMIAKAEDYAEMFDGPEAVGRELGYLHGLLKMAAEELRR